MKHFTAALKENKLLFNFFRRWEWFGFLAYLHVTLQLPQKYICSVQVYFQSQNKFFLLSPSKNKCFPPCCKILIFCFYFCPCFAFIYHLIFNFPLSFFFFLFLLHFPLFSSSFHILWPKWHQLISPPLGGFIFSNIFTPVSFSYILHASTCLSWNPDRVIQMVHACRKKTYGWGEGGEWTY